MIKLRPYKQTDAEKIVGWITDEKAFRLWCADRFQSYPLSAEEFNKIYTTSNSDSFFGMISEDEGEIIGHLFFQNLGNSKYKLGLIIVDSSKRGKGYGEKMLKCALSFAESELDAKTVTLSVFDSNISALNCYKKLGFKETGKFVEYILGGEKHNYFELEYIF